MPELTGNPENNPGQPVPPPPAPPPAQPASSGSATTSFEVPPIPPPPTPGQAAAPRPGPPAGAPVPPPPVPGVPATAPRGKIAVSPGEITLLAAAGVVIIFSFLKWYGSGRFGSSAWDDGLRPLYLLPFFMALFAGLALGLMKFANVKLPPHPLGYTWEHLYLNAGFFAALFTTLAILTDSGGDKKIGLWLSWLGSLGLLVGAVLIMKERRPEAFKN